MSRESGQYYETLAAAFLTDQGLKLLARNFHAYRGELDLVMQERNVLVFVEVKYRKNARFGCPAESISIKKQQHLSHAAGYFLQSRNQYANMPCRFDVIAITGGQTPDSEAKIDWIKNAFLIT